MPVSVCKKASENVPLQHIKNGFHQRDIFANEDGGAQITSGIIAATHHESGGSTYKIPFTAHVIIIEGELSLEDCAKPGEISVLEVGDVIRIDKGTTFTWSSATAGKGFYVVEHEFGTDVKTYLV